MKSKKINPIETTLEAQLASSFVAGSNPVFPTNECMTKVTRRVRPGFRGV